MCSGVVPRHRNKDRYRKEGGAVAFTNAAVEDGNSELGVH